MPSACQFWDDFVWSRQEPSCQGNHLHAAHREEAGYLKAVTILFWGFRRAPEWQGEKTLRLRTCILVQLSQGLGATHSFPVSGRVELDF